MTEGNAQEHINKDARHKADHHGNLGTHCHTELSSSKLDYKHRILIHPEVLQMSISE